MECPSPIRKQPRTHSDDSLRECKKEAGRTNHKDNVARGGSAQKDCGGREEEDSKLSPVTGSADRTNHKGYAANGSSAQKDSGGREEEDSKPSPVTGSAGWINQRGTPNARGSGYVKTYACGGGSEEEDSTPPPETGICAARISSDTAQEVVQEEATPPDAYLPPGWMTLLKVEPDW